ncbi:MAG TPA: helix-turn-helix domain-containing protein [Kofleriaceae bacterium]|jgi:AcrR family transcriptional regulator|nr:helix-turn-helix domain-containing protein [Kofleriaceae bacterium]
MVNVERDEARRRASLDAERDASRRRVLLDAARACFLQFGYAKTSLDDIARRANLSRPLIYRKYKNKEELFGAVYDDTFDARYPEAEKVLAGRGSRRDKLLRIYEIIVVETWAIMMASPMPSEFYEACMRVLPEIHAKHERRLFDLTKEVLGTKEVAEVFMLAAEGLMTDLPSAPVLRKRIQLLTERFVG